MELCNKIKFAFKFEVDSIVDDTIVLNSGFSLKTVKMNDNGIAEEKRQENDNGPLFDQTVKIEFDKDDNDIYNMSYYPMILQLIFENKIIIWGTLENPVRSSDVNVRGNQIEFTFRRKSSSQEF